MDATEMLALAFDPCRILHAQGIAADPWQRELLLSTAPRILLNCCRGAGKSREAAGSGDPRRARALPGGSRQRLLVPRARRGSPDPAAAPDL